MASKRKVRRRVAKALRKYVRGNAGPKSFRKEKKEAKKFWRAIGKPEFTLRKYKKLEKMSNPPRVKGRKTKGGRAVTLRNFSGTIVKKSDGTVQIVGRGRRK